MQPLEPSHDDRLISGIAHIAVLFSALGLALNIALLLSVRKRSPFAAGHLTQALGLQVLSIILSWMGGLYVAMVSFAAGFGRMHPGFFFKKAILLGVTLFVLNGIKLALAVVGAVKGFGGQEYRQPLFGDMLARITW